MNLQEKIKIKVIWLENKNVQQITKWVKIRVNICVKTVRNLLNEVWCIYTKAKHSEETGAKEKKSWRLDERYIQWWIHNLHSSWFSGTFVW